MRALREWAPGEQLAAARAADARALDVVAEDHRPAQGPTPAVPRRVAEVGRIELTDRGRLCIGRSGGDLVGKILDRIVRRL